MATDKYDALFAAAGAANGIDPLLLKAQAIVESALDPLAESPRGALGLAQFMPATWAEWGQGDARDPRAAIDAQARYMAWLLKHFKHDGLTLALAAYNFGIGHVQRETPWPQETHLYVQRVLRTLDELRAAPAPKPEAEEESDGERP